MVRTHTNHFDWFDFKSFSYRCKSTIDVPFLTHSLLFFSFIDYFYCFCISFSLFIFDIGILIAFFIAFFCVSLGRCLQYQSSVKHKHTNLLFLLFLCLYHLLAALASGLLCQLSSWYLRWPSFIYFSAYLLPSPQTHLKSPYCTLSQSPSPPTPLSHTFYFWPYRLVK